MPSRTIAARLTAAALIAAAAVGCGGQRTVVQTVTVSSSSAAAQPAQENAVATPPRRRASAKKSGTPTGAQASSAFIHCDANIQAKIRTTSCGFAQNAFYEYWTSGQSASIDVYSPATDSVYLTQCTPGKGWIVCTTPDDGAVKFTQASIDGYSQSQADAYAAAHNTGPRSSPANTNSSAPSGTADSTPVPDPTSPDTGTTFCDTHDCIPNYPNGNGSTVQCADGSYSHSGGIQGACSHHGGVG